MYSVGCSASVALCATASYVISEDTMMCFQPPVFEGECVGMGGPDALRGSWRGSSLSSSVEERKGTLGPSLLTAWSLNNVESWEKERRRREVNGKERIGMPLPAFLKRKPLRPISG